MPEYAGGWPQVFRVIAAEESHLMVQINDLYQMGERPEGTHWAIDWKSGKEIYAVQAISAHFCWAHPKENKRQAAWIRLLIDKIWSLPFSQKT